MAQAHELQLRTQDALSKPLGPGSWYKGKDGRDYKTYEALKDADRDWFEIMYYGGLRPRGGSLTFLKPEFTSQVVSPKKDELIQPQRSVMGARSTIVVELPSATSARSVRVDRKAVKERWTNIEWLRFRATGETPADQHERSISEVPVEQVVSLKEVENESPRETKSIGKSKLMGGGMGVAFREVLTPIE